jgi:hypothetical protein
MNYNFDENEMPYGILERFGLTQTMIDDLPTDVLQNIYNGRKSCQFISQPMMVRKSRHEPDSAW